MSSSTPPSYVQLSAEETSNSNAELSSDNNEQFTADDANALWNNIPPPVGRVEPLPRPICIPQSSPKFDSPFIRAYPPVATSGIELQDWCQFLDGLNIALIGSPPLKVVGMAGMVIGMVPSVACMAVGTALQLGAGIGQHVISKSLTEKYLAHANEAYFSPRNLRVRLCKTDAMRVLVGLDEAKAVPPSKMKKFGKGAGRVAEGVALHLPIVGGVYAQLVTKQRVDPGTMLVDRRMDPVKDLVMPLSTAVPPEVKPTGMLDKASSLSIKLRNQRTFTSEQTDNYHRQVLAMQRGVATPEMIQQASSNPARFGPIFGNIIGGVEGLTGDRKTADGKRNPSAFMKTVGEYMPVREPRGGGRGGLLGGGMVESRVAVADRKEHLQTKNLIWIVVLNAETDQLIEGTEEADSEDAPVWVTDEQLNAQRAEDVKEDQSEGW